MKRKSLIIGFIAGLFAIAFISGPILRFVVLSQRALDKAQESTHEVAEALNELSDALDEAQGTTGPADRGYLLRLIGGTVPEGWELVPGANYERTDKSGKSSGATFRLRHSARDLLIRAGVHRPSPLEFRRSWLFRQYAKFRLHDERYQDDLVWIHSQVDWPKEGALFAKAHYIPIVGFGSYPFLIAAARAKKPSGLDDSIGYLNVWLLLPLRDRRIVTMWLVTGYQEDKGAAQIEASNKELAECIAALVNVTDLRQICLPDGAHPVAATAKYRRLPESCGENVVTLKSLALGADVGMPPAGKTEIGKWAFSNYGVNYQVFGNPLAGNHANLNMDGNKRSFTTITDGTSQTLAFAEKYRRCGRHGSQCSFQSA